MDLRIDSFIYEVSFVSGMKAGFIGAATLRITEQWLLKHVATSGQSLSKDGLNKSQNFWATSWVITGFTILHLTGVGSKGKLRFKKCTAINNQMNIINT